MQSSEIRERYLKFFEKRGHAVLPSASLIPENDPSSLFITAGMQPLVPYLLGAKHPAGTRLVDVQKCIRTGDIDDVGDNRHLTFFEMMGNWSLGDYFKEDAIKWSLDFLTNGDKEEEGNKGLGLDPKRIYVTTFKGEDGIPRDEDSIKFWKENFAKEPHNMKVEVAGDDEIISGNVRIIPLGKNDNFWIAGATGPCGGDTEMFYDVVGGTLEGKFSDLVKSGRIIEIWNNVFMEFNKTADGKYEPLIKKNVDTGMGLERTTVVMEGKNNVFETEIFVPLIEQIKKSSQNYNEKSARIIADHVRAATFMIADGVLPSNKDQGYVLRRLIRRAIFNMKKIMPDSALAGVDIIGWYCKYYSGIYNNLNAESIRPVFRDEELKFLKTLEAGIKEFNRIIETYWNGELSQKTLSRRAVFDLYTVHGFPIELIEELAKEKGLTIDRLWFEQDMEKHQELSRAGAEQKFKGGLAGTGEMETKYHTATHLLLRALQEVLGGEIMQKGSNITAERMRFDFNWPEKVPAEKLKAVEDLVNQKIAEKLPVTMTEMPKEEAKKVVTVLSFEESKYGNMVKVYKIGDFSAEFCGGPHVTNTSELRHFKIVKEEASSAGVRRIKAVLE